MSSLYSVILDSGVKEIHTLAAPGGAGSLPYVEDEATRRLFNLDRSLRIALSRRPEVNGSQTLAGLLYLLEEKGMNKPRKPQAPRQEPPDQREPYELPPPPSEPDPSEPPGPQQDPPPPEEPERDAAFAFERPNRCPRSQSSIEQPICSIVIKIG